MWFLIVQKFLKNTVSGALGTKNLIEIDTLSNYEIFGRKEKIATEIE